MTILVTGGAGFIGGSLVERLLQDGNSVVVVDNMNAYYDPAIKRNHLALFQEALAGFYEIDIADFEALSGVFEKHHFDLVYHLAAQAGVRYSLSHPEVYERSNVLGTRNMLELSHQHAVPHFIFASSSSVYGDLVTGIFIENEIGTALSPYAKTKQEGEKMCKEYAENFNMNITALRFFTVYGPWGRPDMAVSSFTEKILKGEPIEIYNNGDMKRDFTYIDDIVDGLIRAQSHRNGFDVFNLGRGVPIPLLDFVEVITAEVAPKADIAIVKKPMQPGDMKETYASIRKAQEAFGYQPKMNFVEGVRSFVKWYRTYHNI
jgi:UDP-glucuronate 4-epimerase